MRLLLILSVQQDPILGPVMFLECINNLPYNVNSDFCYLLRGQDAQLNVKSAEVLNSASKWFKCNKLKTISTKRKIYAIFVRFPQFRRNYITFSQILKESVKIIKHIKEIIACLELCKNLVSVPMLKLDRCCIHMVLYAKYTRREPTMKQQNCNRLYRKIEICFTHTYHFNIITEPKPLLMDDISERTPFKTCKIEIMA